MITRLEVITVVAQNRGFQTGALGFPGLPSVDSMGSPAKCGLV